MLNNNYYHFYIQDKIHNLVQDNFFYLMRVVDAQFLMFCDQDDVWFPDKIESMTNIMEKDGRIMVLEGQPQFWFMNGNNHKRILLKLFVLALIWMSAPQAFAYSFQVNGIYYTRAGSSSSKVVMVSNRSSLGGDYSGDIVIPETVEYAGDTYSVQYVAQGAFINCPQLTSVELPNTIISIIIDSI